MKNFVNDGPFPCVTPDKTMIYGKSWWMTVSTQQMQMQMFDSQPQGGLKHHICLSKASMHTIVWEMKYNICVKWDIVFFSTFLPFLPSFFYIYCSCSNHRAAPAPQEVVCSSGRGRISPSSSALGDGGLRLLPTEVLHTASQRAAQRRLENTHQWYPLQRDHLDCGEVRIFGHDVDP